MTFISQPKTLSALDAGLVVLAQLGCGKAGQVETKPDETAEVEAKPKWDYSEQRGPEQWGELSPDYVLAAIGSSQSPIDIVTDDVITADLPNLHAPSEHTINGEPAEVEVHFVHADGAGQLAVLGVLIEEGKEDNPVFLSILEDQAPTEAGEEKVFSVIKVDVGDYFPDSIEDDDYFMYDGSLTTPPASEGVPWFVCAKPIQLSRRQIDVLTSLYSHNNRPVQPAYTRTVLTPRRPAPNLQD